MQPRNRRSWYLVTLERMRRKSVGRWNGSSRTFSLSSLRCQHAPTSLSINCDAPNQYNPATISLNKTSPRTELLSLMASANPSLRHHTSQLSNSCWTFTSTLGEVDLSRITFLHQNTYKIHHVCVRVTGEGHEIRRRTTVEVSTMSAHPNGASVAPARHVRLQH